MSMKKSLVKEGETKMPRRNKNVKKGGQKRKTYNVIEKHQQKLEVEKKVEQQLAYIQQQENRKRKQLQEDEESKQNKCLEDIGATITLLLVVGLIVMSLFILWLGR